jgi:hypothetical protein
VHPNLQHKSLPSSSEPAIGPYGNSNGAAFLLFFAGYSPSITLFAWLNSHQPAVLFSQNKPATNNQPAVLLSQKKSAPAISQTNRL